MTWIGWAFLTALGLLLVVTTIGWREALDGWSTAQRELDDSLDQLRKLRANPRSPAGARHAVEAAAQEEFELTLRALNAADSEAIWARDLGDMAPVADEYAASVSQAFGLDRTRTLGRVVARTAPTAQVFADAHDLGELDKQTLHAAFTSCVLDGLRIGLILADRLAIAGQQEAHQ